VAGGVYFARLWIDGVPVEGARRVVIAPVSPQP
jgi:hypothetical protein